MGDAIITLTTDFGNESPYVAAMKGVILGINPSARLVDLSHLIPPQDLRYTAWFLAASIPYFAPEVIHVIVVDPGVGTDRALLYVEANPHRLLVPDNGCWTVLGRALAQPPKVIRLTEGQYWRHPVSATFHGRDILAPAAAHLSLGLTPEELGPATTDWIRLETPTPTFGPDSIVGEVVFVDRFGNLMTNIPGEALSRLPPPLQFKVGNQAVTRRVRTYAEAEPETPVALVSSEGMLEIAVTAGNAARRLQAGIGSRVEARLVPGD
jgi:S-adenosylmethionine hydrolase